MGYSVLSYCQKLHIFLSSVFLPSLAAFLEDCSFPSSEALLGCSLSRGLKRKDRPLCRLLAFPSFFQTSWTHAKASHRWSSHFASSLGCSRMRARAVALLHPQSPALRGRPSEQASSRSHIWPLPSWLSPPPAGAVAAVSALLPHLTPPLYPSTLHPTLGRPDSSCHTVILCSGTLGGLIQENRWDYMEGKKSSLQRALFYGMKTPINDFKWAMWSSKGHNWGGNCNLFPLLSYQVQSWSQKARSNGSHGRESQRLWGGGKSEK